MSDGVLITGGAGLLGLNLALAYRDRLSVTLGLHNRQVSLARTNACLLDLDDTASILSTLDAIRPRLVIHAAGFTRVDECELRQQEARTTNVDLATNVARACASRDIALIQISTDHLFAGNAAFLDEEAPVFPVNVYAETKAEAEGRVLSECPGALVIRTNFYGWGTQYRQSFSDQVLSALRSEQTITLFDDVFYTPILIYPLADAMLDLVNLGASGIFHLVGDQRISKYEFGIEVAKVFGLDPTCLQRGSIHDKPQLAKRPGDMSLANGKACRLLGRKLGKVVEHLEMLRLQESDGLAMELMHL